MLGSDGREVVAAAYARSSREDPAVDPIVVMAMAGKGQRFSELKGESSTRGVPKPLIDVAGRPMIWWALQSLAGIRPRRLVFVVRADDEKGFGIVSRTREVCADLVAEGVLDSDDIEFVEQDAPDGQLTSVLAAQGHIEADSGLLVAGCDTWVVADLHAQIGRAALNSSGFLSVADLPGDRWSFAATNDQGRVVRVAEKERISSHACTGLYYFTSGGEFLREAKRLVQTGGRVRGEFYVAPIFQQMIESGAKVGIGAANKVFEMGTPAACADFLKQVRSTFVERSVKSASDADD